MGGIAGAVVAAFDHFWPEKQLMSLLFWQIPIWGFVAAMGVRLFCAPYWMAKEDEKLRKEAKQNKPRLKLSYAADKALERADGSKITFLYATNEGQSDVSGAQVKIEQAQFRKDGSDKWEGTSIVSAPICRGGHVPDVEPQKYSTVPLAPGSEVIDFISGPHNFKQQDGQTRLGFLIRIDPRHWGNVNPAFCEKGTYKFVMQASALDIEKPDKLTLLVDWDGTNLVIRSDEPSQILESSKVLQA
jgi:hypothetical protein